MTREREMMSINILFITDWLHCFFAVHRDKQQVVVTAVHHSIRRLMLFHSGTAFHGSIVVNATALPRLIIGAIYNWSVKTVLKSAYMIKLSLIND